MRLVARRIRVWPLRTPRRWSGGLVVARVLFRFRRLPGKPRV